MSEKPKKPKKERCFFKDCKTKLKLTDWDCRCGHKYCSVHRSPEDHACDHDYKKMYIKPEGTNKSHGMIESI